MPDRVRRPSNRFSGEIALNADGYSGDLSIMAARGRKRKSGKRYPSDERMREKDLSTVQRIETRQKIMGAANRSPDFPLSVLLAKQRIDHREHAAGMWFAALHARLYGSSHAGAALWQEFISGGDGRGQAAFNAIAEEAAEMDFAAAMAALDGQCNRILARQLVFQLAVRLERDWFLWDVVSNKDIAERHRQRWKTLHSALHALAECRDDCARRKDAIANCAIAV